MKMRDIVLDFTPLLDITLILLFFFILFGHLEVEQAQSVLDEKAAQAETAMVQAQQLEEQLEEELALLQSAGERQGSNIQSMMTFNRSRNIKLILNMEDSGRELKVFRGEELIRAVSIHSEDVAADLFHALMDAGYREDDTVLCEFLLDGTQPGTAAAYRTVSDALLVLKGDYPYLYDSETDISLGRE